MTTATQLREALDIEADPELRNRIFSTLMNHFGGDDQDMDDQVLFQRINRPDTRRPNPPALESP